MANLGNAYNNLGNSKKSIQYFERALSIYESVYDKNHPHYVHVLKSLQNLQSKLKLYEDNELYIMNIKELMTIALNKGIDTSSCLEKKDIIDLIKTNM